MEPDSLADRQNTSNSDKRTDGRTCSLLQLNCSINVYQQRERDMPHAYELMATIQLFTFEYK